jgi:predicted alpha/beta superfamily hydrolase
MLFRKRWHFSEQQLVDIISKIRKITRLHYTDGSKTAHLDLRMTGNIPLQQSEYQTSRILLPEYNVNWQPYHDVYPRDAGHRTVGHVLVAKNVHSPQLNNDRDIIVYLPPSYDSSSKHYPVLYMHDGQNLFDHATSFAGEWLVDETLQELAYEEGLETIVVGISNKGAKRLDEYSPFVDHSFGGGLGNKYISFISNTLKPLIDSEFRTLPQRRKTGIMGSSMGGLISLYAFFFRENIFGFAGAMSPSLWFAHGAIYGYIETASYLPGKVYIDAGTRELGGSAHAVASRSRSRNYYAGVRRMKRLLVKKGYRPTRDILYIEEKWARHGEEAWARRLPRAIRFFLEQ